MSELFFIPDNSEKNNNITDDDIKNGYLRITKNNKKYFPNEDCDVIVIIENNKHVRSFRTRDNDGKPRSYTLHLGVNLINKLIQGNPKTVILECEKIGDKKYKISK